MPRSGTYGDTVSDVSGAATGLTVSMRTPAEVRAAQLVVTSVVWQDPISVADALLDEALQAEIREVLSAIGIYNRSRRVVTAPARATTGTVRVGVARYRGKREPNGRLSRKGRDR